MEIDELYGLLTPKGKETIQSLLNLPAIQVLAGGGPEGNFTTVQQIFISPSA